MLARRPWLYWLAIGSLATGTYASVATRARAHDVARERWGRTRAVLVADTPLEPGDPLTGAVRLAEWPLALVPPGALDAAEPGAVARQRVGQGEAVTAVDVAPDGGPLGLTPPGWAVVPVVESPPSGAALGERVRVAAEGIVLAADGLVVGTVAPNVTLVAVPEPDAPAISAAADAGTLVLVRRP